MALLLIGLFVLSTVPITTAEQSVEQRNQKVIQEYNILKQEYKQITNEWKNSKTDYLQTKKKLQRFNQLTPEEQEIHFEKAQEFMTRTLDRMEKHLEILQKWSERVIQDDSQQQEIIEDLGTHIKNLNEFKVKVSEAITIQELRSVGNEINDYWKNSRADIKRVTGTILATKVNNIILRAETLSEKLHIKINSLDQSHEEVQEMQTLLKEFDTKIVLARENYEHAKGAYTQIRSLSEVDELFNQTKGFLKDADKYLKESHKILKKLVRLYRINQGNFPEINSNNDAPGVSE